jgi:hypothetical protein
MKLNLQSESLRNEGLFLEIDSHAARITSHASHILELEAQLEATELETREEERGRQKSVEECKLLFREIESLNSTIHDLNLRNTGYISSGLAPARLSLNLHPIKYRDPSVSVLLLSLPIPKECFLCSLDLVQYFPSCLVTHFSRFT